MDMAIYICIVVLLAGYELIKKIKKPEKNHKNAYEDTEETEVRKEDNDMEVKNELNR